MLLRIGKTITLYILGGMTHYKLLAMQYFILFTKYNSVYIQELLQH